MTGDVSQVWCCKEQTFYKNLHDDTIEYSSFDVEDIIDSISVYYNSLMNGVNSIVSERNPVVKANTGNAAEDNEVVKEQ